MKITESYIREIIKEEIKNLRENLENEGEHKIAHLAYLMLGKLREEFEDHMGNVNNDSDISKEFELLHDSISESWMVADKMLTGGETGDGLPGLYEAQGDCTQEEVSNALDVVSRCVMSGQSQRPKSTETELGIMPSKAAAPPEGTSAGGVKWIKEEESNE